MAKVGSKDGIQARERKEDSREAKTKDRTHEHTVHVNRKEREKECKERVTTVDKLDIQQGCAHTHQKGKEKERE